MVEFISGFSFQWFSCHYPKFKLIYFLILGTDPNRTSQRVSPPQWRATPASPVRKDSNTRRQTKSTTKITREAGTSRQKNKRKQPIDPSKLIVLNDDDSFDDGYNHLFNNVAESPPEDFTEDEGSHDSWAQLRLSDGYSIHLGSDKTAKMRGFI